MYDRVCREAEPMSEPAKSWHCATCRATVDADRRELTADWAHTWEAGSRTYASGRMVYQCPQCRPGGAVTKTGKGKR